MWRKCINMIQWTEGEVLSVRLFYLEEVYKYDTVNRERGIICEVVLCGGSVQIWYSKQQRERYYLWGCFMWRKCTNMIQWTTKGEVLSMRLFYVEEVYKYDTVNRGRGIICEVVLCGSVQIWYSEQQREIYYLWGCFMWRKCTNMIPWTEGEVLSVRLFYVEEVYKYDTVNNRGRGIICEVALCGGSVQIWYCEQQRERYYLWGCFMWRKCTNMIPWTTEGEVLSVRLFYVEEVYKYDTVNNRGRGIICEVVLCGGSVQIWYSEQQRERYYL